jgi:diguanylate cyclase (GGDEF)-like protein
MFYLSYKQIIKALAFAAGGVAMVLGLIFLLVPEPLDFMRSGHIVVILWGIFGYIFIIQHKALQKHRLQEKKIEQERMLREISCGLFDNVLEADITENKIMGENCQKLASLLGIEGNENYDEIIYAIAAQLVREEFRDEYKKMFSRETMINLCNDNKPGFEYEFIERSDGINYAWVRTYVRIYRAFDTGAVKIISHVKNIQQEKERELAIIIKAQRDPLTNLYNKAVTKELIDEFLIPEDGQGIHALYLIDVDNFKAINDNYGHSFGDTVISTMADKLSQFFRTSDIVGRVGGDEFLVFMKDVTDRSVVSQKAEEIREGFHDLLKSISVEVEMSLSIGICMLPEDGASFDEIYKKADVALYVSKNKGKNTFTFYDTQ